MQYAFYCLKISLKMHNFILTGNLSWINKSAEKYIWAFKKRNQNVWGRIYVQILKKHV